MTQREFDIVIYGATGFVGKLTAEYLAKAGGDARIALAGRSPQRLAAVRATLGEAAQSWPILEADASSPASLDAMAARTRVVITTVGPYSRYGLPLVAACAAAGTDYADLTGEAMFVRKSIDDFHKQAIDTGARIVHACGFDSVPSDMSVYALFRRAEQDGEAPDPATEAVRRRKRSVRRLGIVAAILALLAAALAAGAFYLSTVFFIGVDDGALTIYSGVPGKIGPVPLHAVYRRSVVTYDSLSPSARTLVDEQQLRDREDALDLSKLLGMWP